VRYRLRTLLIVLAIAVFVWLSAGVLYALLDQWMPRPPAQLPPRFTLDEMGTRP
jgi:hypothetical protein